MAAAEDFVHRSAYAVAQKNICDVVLSGGNTPNAFYEVLTSPNFISRIPWEHLRFFFGDERYVPADDPQSNFFMAQKFLFSKVPVASSHIYPMPTHFSDPRLAAQTYQSTLRQLFLLDEDAYPSFDICYLGLGADGHTASLFPHTEVVETYSRDSKARPGDLVIALWVEACQMNRISLTPAALNHSKEIVFLVTGFDKADAVEVVINRKPNALLYPAQLIHQATWFVDEEAAGILSS